MNKRFGLLFVYIRDTDNSFMISMLQTNRQATSCLENIYYLCTVVYFSVWCLKKTNLFVMLSFPTPTASPKQSHR